MNFHFVFVISVLVQSTSTTHTYFSNMRYECIKPQDCTRIKQMFPGSKSGVYTIYPGGIGIGVHVYCDMFESCGGWTVIQRRVDGTGIFYRNWDDYKKGFGKPHKNYWLGNDIIYQLTANRNHEMLIVLKDFDNTTRYAHYRNFSIGSEKEKYKLSVTGYSGNAGDSLAYHNGYPFSTHDRDNDVDTKNCAAYYKGAWWYKNCFKSSLNGEFVSGGTKTTTADSYGLVWESWKGYRYSLKSTVMMLR